MGHLDGKVAVVTGAGRLRGIGRAAAVALAQEGADIVVTGTGRDPATFPSDEKEMGWRDITSTAEQVRAVGVRCLEVVCDVTNAAEVNRVVDQAMEQFGRIDVLVNNAAAPRGDDRVPVVDVDEDVFRRVVDIKVHGSFLFSKAVGQVLIRQNASTPDVGGSIVNISSIAGRRGSANTAAYNAANFAIHGFTQAFAHEMAPYKVTVNAVCPGPVDTSRMDAVRDAQGGWEASAARVPLGRVASDDDIGRVITWLCSPDASLITGQAINVNGGMHMD
jgi:NAD(P)-dependent dehydrogenase (short-subunit alcohol dehydrogenase family)